jgi:hypothetical protein
MRKWDHQRGTITDITKTVRQVKKILNLIFWENFLSRPELYRITAWGN